jgi:hypothetical protein
MTFRSRHPGIWAGVPSRISPCEISGLPKDGLLKLRNLRLAACPPSIGFCLGNRLYLRNVKACRDILTRFLDDLDSE